MKTHQITGLGPVQADGSVDLFTVRPHPYHVTKEWLDNYAAMPKPGDTIEEAEDGSLTLSTIDVGTAQAEEAQKKTMVGSEGSDAGSNASPLPSYNAKAVTIHAGKITDVKLGADIGDATIVTLEDGSTRSMAAGNPCGLGDYWCTDGAYEWYMPAAMFADKFEVAA